MKKRDTFDDYFKILIIGESGVGKTCISLRFTEDVFVESHIATIGTSSLYNKIRNRLQNKTCSTK